MRSVELFAGAGGLAMGLADAGYDHAVVIERNRWACDTIRENKRRNHRLVADWPLVETDVRNFDYSVLAEKVDFVAGGPPCQPFSLGGKHRGHLDSRDMFPEAVRAVREIRPKAFVFENVRGLVRSTFFNYFQYIQLQLQFPEIVSKPGEEWLEHYKRLQAYNFSGRPTGLHYNVHAKVLNAANYSIPQRRERVFIVGFRSDLSIEWSYPRETHSEEALLYSQWVDGDYWDRHEVSKRQRAVPSDRQKRTIERLKIDGLPDGIAPWRTVRDVISDLPHPRKSGRTDNVANHRFQPGARIYPGHTGSPIDAPAKTLKAGDHGVPGGENMLRYPNGKVRYFTVRESARLQTFPDDFVFHGSWTETMRQLGNAVPVDLAKILGRDIAAHL